MVIFTQFVQHKTLSLSWSKMKSKFCAAIATTTARNNQLRIIHTARERRHFHFTYDFKVSAVHAVHFISLVAKWSQALLFSSFYPFNFHSIRAGTHTESVCLVQCTKCMHIHTKNQSHAYMHQQYAHVSTNTVEILKCAQFHSRNTWKEKYFLIFVVIAFVCTAHVVSKRVFCSSFEIFVLPFIMIQMQWNLYDHE